jgi:hypothetical protein
MIADGIIGFLSSSAATALIFPIDVVKTNFQMQTEQLVRRSALDVTREIFKTKGLSGFYQGMTPQLITYPIFWSVFFPVKAFIEKKELCDNYYVNKVAITYLSATIGSTISNPLFVLKTNMQIDNKQSIYSITKKLYADSGSSWIARGWTATMLNNSKLCLQFPLYDIMREKYNSDVISASFISKTVTTSLFYPLDLVRTKQRSIGNLTLIKAFRIVLNHSGFTGLYRGVMLNFITSTPNFVLTMWFKDILDNLVQKN